MTPVQEKILELKKQKNILILAHFYQPIEIQQIADYICDSFEMAKRARDAAHNTMIICGVKFMAESAKILSPQKTVLFPSPDAGCPMADMVEPEDVLRLREQYPEAAVVCYVNSSAAVKAVSDICCTSSSAVRIVKSLPNRQIIFVPDQNLGAYIAKQVPEKEVILFAGFCPTHHAATEAEAISAKAAHPDALFLAHPECRDEVLRHADFIGSTAEILKTVQESELEEFIIATELGVVDRISTLAPDKRCYLMNNHFICPNMKKTTAEDVLYCLENGGYEVTLSDEEIEGAALSLQRMVNA